MSIIPLQNFTRLRDYYLLSENEEEEEEEGDALCCVDPADDRLHDPGPELELWLEALLEGLPPPPPIPLFVPTDVRAPPPPPPIPIAAEGEDGSEDLRPPPPPWFSERVDCDCGGGIGFCRDVVLATASLWWSSLCRGSYGGRDKESSSSSSSWLTPPPTEEEERCGGGSIFGGGPLISPSTCVKKVCFGTICPGQFGFHLSKFRALSFSSAPFHDESATTTRRTRTPSTDEAQSRVPPAKDGSPPMLELPTT